MQTPEFMQAQPSERLPVGTEVLVNGSCVGAITARNGVQVFLETAFFTGWINESVFPKTSDPTTDVA